MKIFYYRRSICYMDKTRSNLKNYFSKQIILELDTNRFSIFRKSLNGL
ncbi:hypothetical protein LEP1GSC124_4128 [Leptospira interrogans serovar Pyrogenes str. 200701872]|uniref:Uncharacterized protein n=1 Tax=Leptospira interrogans serovar Pyrogenes str. 200701872 TaxID=1193029 RepID=M6ZLX3_LEPIR|nr:hypothetical protein LEP1GSC124_4128 [Leptospira interrogans serovar Pyrogenes str. 200701872]